MFWELRTTPSADLVGQADDLNDVLALGRECLDAGWPLEDLYICAEWDEGEEGDDADLPPILQGAELLARMGEVGPGRARRSA